eukprot:s965_g22.t1
MTMADAVPLPLRMSLREEVLEQAPDKDAQMSSALLAEHKESVWRFMKSWPAACLCLLAALASSKVNSEYVGFLLEINHNKTTFPPRLLEEMPDLVCLMQCQWGRGQYCLAYEGLRKRGFEAIPWSERDVRALLNRLAEDEVTPYKLQQVWNTLKWFSKVFGLLNIDEVPLGFDRGCLNVRYSFSGKDWWPGWVATIRKLCKLPKFQDMDYLIPTVTKDFNGIIARPSTPDRGLRWLKDALIRQGVERSQVDPLTWHSFRVFIPDCAFQLGIPRAQRQYLGNWLSESIADVYTREKRNVVVSIWNPVAAKVPRLDLDPGKERREDLNHPDWNVQIPDGEALGENLPGAHDTPESGKSSRWSIVGTQVEHPSPTELFPDLSQHGLRVVVTVAKATAVGLYRIHLLTDEGVAVGCGWRPKAGAITELTHLDFPREPEAYSKCTRCFKGHTFPATWTQDEEVVADAPLASSSDPGTGSETDDSVDTGSGQEGEDVDKLNKGLSVILVARQIPWHVQAAMGRQGYVTPEAARQNGPTDFGFVAGTHGFDEATTAFTAMRLLQAEGERPTKKTKRFTLDGWEGHEEEEIRANPTTRRQLERMHMVFRTNLLMCLASVPQFGNLALTKQELDDWYDWFYG